MSKKNRVIKLGKDESLYDSSDKNLQYETVERDKDSEKANIAYANSRRGRFVAGLDRLTDKLWQTYNRCYLFSKRKLVEYWTLSIKSLDILRLFIYNEYCNKKLRKDKKMSKDNTTTTKEKVTKVTEKNKKNKDSLKYRGWYFNPWNWNWHGIMGILTLFVIISIAYTSWVVIQGTDDPIHRIMLVPMVLWAVIKLFKQFIKQGDK